MFLEGIRKFRDGLFQCVLDVFGRFLTDLVKVLEGFWWVYLIVFGKFVGRFIEGFSGSV